MINPKRINPMSARAADWIRERCSVNQGDDCPFDVLDPVARVRLEEQCSPVFLRQQLSACASNSVDAVYAGCARRCPKRSVN
jgi:hypothetical protein